LSYKVRVIEGNKSSKKMAWRVNGFTTSEREVGVIEGKFTANEMSEATAAHGIFWINLRVQLRVESTVKLDSVGRRLRQNIFVIN